MKLDRRGRSAQTPSVTASSYSASHIFKSSSSPSGAWSERIFRWVLQFTAVVSLLTTVAIIFVLISESLGFFKHISLKEFFGSLEWSPLIEPRHFGIWPLICGTLLVGVGAILVAVPIGAMAALYLSEYVKGAAKTFIKALLEVLAGVPTVVYGFFAITFITPKIQLIFPETEVFNALSAALVVAIMIIPTISSVSQDAFESVPKELREAAYGLGARKYQVATTVVFPAGLSGFIASIILGFSRAIGETMAVTLAAGATPKLTLNPLESIQTMTSYIVQVSLGDTPTGTIEYQTIFVVGLVLFIMTLASNLVAQWIAHKFHERYV